MKNIYPSESEIQKSVIDYLRYKKYFVLRLNSGQFAVGEGTNKRYIRGMEAGTPDLMAFRGIECARGGVTHVQLLFIEDTRPGNKPTDLQKAKMEELERYGARCLTVHSIEELEQAGVGR